MRNYAFILLLSCVVELAHSNNEVQLKVVGNARVFETPRIMILEVPIEVKDSVYSRCADSLMYKYNELMEEFARYGIEKKEVVTGNLNLRESYSYVQRKRQKLYRGKLQINFERVYDKNLLRDLALLLRQDRFSYGYSVRFKLSEEQKDALLKHVLELAIKNAQRKAEIILGKLSYQQSKLVSIDTEWSGIFGLNELETQEVAYYDDVYAVAPPAIRDRSPKGKMGILLEPETKAISRSISMIWLIH